MPEYKPVYIALRMKSVVCFFFLIIALSVNVRAQTFPSEVFHEGMAVLVEGDTIYGRIKYDFDNDLIQLNLNNVMRTYSSRKLLYFEIYDDVVESFRYFYALPYGVRTGYKVPIIFEILYEGELTLLAREYIVQETVPQWGYYTRGMGYAGLRLSYEYYYLRKNGEIMPYNQKKKELYDVMAKRSTEVKQYMKKNRLRYDRRNDLVRVTAFYNQLME